jgi:hypothetical protein
MVIGLTKEEEKKKPRIETLEDKGTKVDLVDFGDGRQTFLYREEKFRGLDIAGVRLGWREKYKIITPEQLSPLSKGTIYTMSDAVSTASASSVKPSDFEFVSTAPVAEKKKKENEEKVS